jgi:hypothetical protein
MKPLFVVAVAVLVNVSLVQAQSRAARVRDQRGSHGPGPVRIVPNVAARPDAWDETQRPARQCLCDPSLCRAAEGSHVRQRLRDPALCPRVAAAGRGHPRGAGWGGACGTNRVQGWNRLYDLYSGRCGHQGKHRYGGDARD